MQGPMTALNLRHHPGGPRLGCVHRAVSGQCIQALLYPGAARINEPDHRAARLHGHIDDLHDLSGVHPAHGPVKYGEILGIDRYGPAVYGRVSRHHPVAGCGYFLHTKIKRLMLSESVHFDKTLPIYQSLYPFPCRQFPSVMLRVDGLRASTLPDRLLVVLHGAYPVFHIHRCSFIPP